MEMKLWDIAGNIYSHKYVVYVVPPAFRGFIDDEGNRMILWDDGDQTIDNPFIIIEGFDPENDNNPNMYYKKSNGLFDKLKSLGQDIIVLDFAEGGIDMATNAQYVADAIHYIASIRSGTTPIKLLGVSMGGVICRFALAKAEHNGIPLDVSHFVSVDSPQQDAVIDTDLQEYIKRKKMNPGGFASMAAKQMLRDNVFATANEHDNFYNILKQLNGDGYPDLCKTIGVAFAPNIPNANSGKWLDVKTNIAGYVDWESSIDPGEPIKEAGSYLPVTSTLQWGSAPLPFKLSLGVHVVSYELRRFTHPTFIPHKSALDLDEYGRSKFATTIASTTHGFHDEVPPSVVDPLIDALGLTLPLTVSIGGPATLAVGQNGTWTAVASGGKTPYIYRWQYLFTCPGGMNSPESYGVEYGSGGTTPNAENCGMWSNYISGSTFARSISSNSILQLKLTVTDTSSPVQTVVTYKDVTIGVGGGQLASKQSGIQEINVSGYPAEKVAGLALDQNYPNPFNPSTEIRFSLPEAVHVRLVVYDLMGREVARLVDGPMSAGGHAVTFDASPFPTATYLYQLTAGGFTRTGRMTLLK